MNIRWADRLYPEIVPCPLLLMPPQQFGGFLHPHAALPFCRKHPSTETVPPTAPQTKKHVSYQLFSVSRQRPLSLMLRPDEPRTEVAMCGTQSCQLRCSRVLRLPVCQHRLTTRRLKLFAHRHDVLGKCVALDNPERKKHSFPWLKTAIAQNVSRNVRDQ